MGGWRRGRPKKGELSDCDREVLRHAGSMPLAGVSPRFVARLLHGRRRAAILGGLTSAPSFRSVERQVQRSFARLERLGIARSYSGPQRDKQGRPTGRRERLYFVWPEDHYSNPAVKRAIMEGRVQWKRELVERQDFWLRTARLATGAVVKVVVSQVVPKKSPEESPLETEEGRAMCLAIQGFLQSRGRRGILVMASLVPRQLEAHLGEKPWKEDKNGRWFRQDSISLFVPTDDALARGIKPSIVRSPPLPQTRDVGGDDREGSSQGREPQAKNTHPAVERAA